MRAPSAKPASPRSRPASTRAFAPARSDPARARRPAARRASPRARRSRSRPSCPRRRRSAGRTNSQKLAITEPGFPGRPKHERPAAHRREQRLARAESRRRGTASGSRARASAPGTRSASPIETPPQVRTTSACSSARASRALQTPRAGRPTVGRAARDDPEPAPARASRKSVCESRTSPGPDRRRADDLVAGDQHLDDGRRAVTGPPRCPDSRGAPTPPVTGACRPSRSRSPPRTTSPWRRIAEPIRLSSAAAAALDRTRPFASSTSSKPTTRSAARRHRRSGHDPRRLARAKRRRRGSPGERQPGDAVQPVSARGPGEGEAVERRDIRRRQVGRGGDRRGEARDRRPASAANALRRSRRLLEGLLERLPGGFGRDHPSRSIRTVRRLANQIAPCGSAERATVGSRPRG